MNSVFDLVAKLTLDTSDYENKLGSSTDILGTLGKGIGAITKATATAVTVGAGAVTAVTKQAVDAFANYEQLEGGVETLFGNDAQKVLDNASKAFNTAGMSMNAYMETSIQSAAALINSLEGDTSKAADLMDMSITDMSDNVNKMGTSMEAVQNAYRGFSRGNFTMLDNLALGFSGTKEGMQELLDKAKEISGIQYDISSYSDIVEAIHVVQTEMGIAGTTSQEASETISGSMSSVKAAWSNLVSGMANENADMGQLITNFVDSASTMVSNMLPTVERALEGVGRFVEQMAPVLAEKLPQMVDNLLPSLLKSATSLVASLAKALPAISQTLIKAIPNIVKALSDTIKSSAPEIIQAFVDGILMLLDVALDMLPLIIDLGLQMIIALAQGLGDALPELVPKIIEVLLEIVNTLTDPNNLMALVNAAIAIIMALADGLIEALPILIDALPLIIENLINALVTLSPQLTVAGVELIIKLVGGILSAIPHLVKAAPQILMSFIAGLYDMFANLITAGEDIIIAIGEGIEKMIDGASKWGKDLIDNFVAGIKGGIGKVKDAVTNVADTVKDFLGFSEPDKGPLSNFHTYAPDMIDLFTEGIEHNIGRISDTLNDNLSVPELPTVDMPNASGTYTIPIYIGQERIEEVVINAIDMQNYRVGGR